jgi:glyoxylase-like metal-dependent hydrolase (beta-lactamase superfamily II)
MMMGAAALLAVTPLAAQQAAQKPETIRVGTATEVWVLQETSGQGNTGVLVDAPARVLADHAPDGTFPNATNAVLVRRGDDVTLIDAGYGRTIFEKMAALGIAPEDVDRVLLTHMHGDHIGGMLRDGARAFPNATVALSQREYDHFSGPGNEGAARVFEAYKGSLEMLSPGEITSPMAQGFTPIAAYGHTPGHTMFMIRDGYEQLLVWGDLTHAMAIQMPHPEISVRYDSDPAVARDNRIAVLRAVAAERTPVVGMHVAATSPGQVSDNGEGGYDFRVR